MGISVGSSPKRNRTETRAKAARLHTRSNMSGKHGVAGFSPRFSLRMQRSSFIILTGLSGSGKGTFLRALEDRGYFCVDNLPLGLLSKFYELILKSDHDSAKAALVIDVREGDLERISFDPPGNEKRGHSRDLTVVSGSLRRRAGS